MKTLFSLFVAIAFMPTAWASSDWKVIESNSTITFEATGRPSMLKIKGTGKNLSGQVSITGNEAQGEFTLDLNTLQTGIELRDKHMKEKYLEVEKNPRAVFKFQKIKIETGVVTSLQTSSRDFDGSLTLHGVERPVHGTFEISSGNELEAQFEVKISDFKIEIPSYMGITVADVVKVHTHIALEKRK